MTHPMTPDLTPDLTSPVSPTSLYIVLCNCPPAAAPDIARALLSDSLAACVNILPAVRSLYMWDGALQDDLEATLLIKTTLAAFPALRDRILDIHPYSTPEVVAIAACDANDAYAQWVLQSVRVPTST
jgi:periplasmic divalent cation tolerance protein